MYDLLPFPNIVATDIPELVAQTNNYLMQFKETLEFILTNISSDNLSPDLVAKLNDLGAEVEKNEERDDQITQVSSKSLTISDVINSNPFKAALDDVAPKKYLVSAEQTQSSEEPEGINLYAIEDSSGEIKTFTVKNGAVPDVTFTVNFNTGKLEYITSKE